jgi:hypothetical protein
MAKRIQPKLNQPKDHVIRQALFAGCWNEGESLLRNLWLAQRKAEGSTVLTESCGDYLDGAAQAAALLHDYIALLGLPDFLATEIDHVIRRNAQYASLREQALALVAEMDRCVAVSRRAAA